MLFYGRQRKEFFRDVLCFGNFRATPETKVTKNPKVKSEPDSKKPKSVEYCVPCDIVHENGNRIRKEDVETSDFSQHFIVGFHELEKRFDNKTKNIPKTSKVLRCIRPLLDEAFKPENLDRTSYDYTCLAKLLKKENSYFTNKKNIAKHKLLQKNIV